MTPGLFLGVLLKKDLFSWGGRVPEQHVLTGSEGH